MWIQILAFWIWFLITTYVTIKVVYDYVIKRVYLTLKEIKWFIIGAFVVGGPLVITKILGVLGL